MVHVTLLLLAYAQTVDCLNILLFLLGTTQQERAPMEHLAQSLALRHHTVITVKPVLVPEEPRLVKPVLHLVREKTLKNLLKRQDYQPLIDVWNTAPWSTEYDYSEYLTPYYHAHNASCAKMLNSDLTQVLHKEKIDVTIAYAGNPCQMAIAHVIGSPVIYFDTQGLTDETLVATGAPLQLNFPLSNCYIDENKNYFLTRAARSVCLLREYIAQAGLPLLSAAASRRYRLLDHPISKQFAEDYSFKKRFPMFPSAHELIQSSALFFLNTDVLLEYERALPPHVVPVGGMHLEPARPLFAPWNTTVQGSKDGTILVSFGTHANTSAMTHNQAIAIYKALARLNTYRVIWCVGPSLSLPGLDVKRTAPHINITSYIPQIDLLAEKRTRLLLTNGGPASLMEAISHGVPILGIPLYGENEANLEKAAYKGLGVVVSKKDLTATSLYNALKKVLDSNKYKAVAKDMAREFRTRQRSPLETALHYIEHVGRHRSAAFVRPPVTTPLSFLLLLPLDVALILLTLLLLPLLIVYRIVTRSFGRAAILTPSRTLPNSELKEKAAKLLGDVSG